jgi:predicted TIM-barrel fold metal-dependent hydrolase
MKLGRRSFLGGALGATTAASVRGQSAGRAGENPPATDLEPLLLTDFRPKSRLVVPEHRVERARFPAIDMHTHVGSVFRRTPKPGDALQGNGEARLARIVEWMDALNLKTMINLPGGFGSDQLRETVKGLDQRYPGRFYSCIQPDYRRLRDPDYPQWQAEDLERAKRLGAVGLKINKTLGLYLREGLFREHEREPGQQGPLVKIDDERLWPMWKAAGELKLPVFIHISDPDAFFTPVDRYNERWEELSRHPEARFTGGDLPSKQELLDARNRIIEMNPGTTFIGLHVATNPENLRQVAAWLDRYPNFHVEIAASLGELGRQPRQARWFFETYRNRIMFGTDASPSGTQYPQQDLKPEMYQCYFRFLETLDEYFDYSPAEFPPQGFWKIYGIGLPDGLLKDFYHNNAARLLGWETI